MDDKVLVSYVAYALMDFSKFFKCTYEEAWDRYIISLVKEEVTFNEVMDYINGGQYGDKTKRV